MSLSRGSVDTSVGRSRIKIKIDNDWMCMGDVVVDVVEDGRGKVVGDVGGDGVSVVELW